MHYLSFRQQTFLLLAERMDQERSVSALYHILTGKKSSQTIQDMKWYGITSYFRMFPYWKERDFERETNGLLDKGLVHISENRVLMDKTGIEQNAGFLSAYRWPEVFNGWLYGRNAAVFWKRLALFIQCISQSLAGNRAFLPVFEDLEVQHWLKRNWPGPLRDKQEAAAAMYRELQQLLEQMETKDAALITYRLTGWQYTGQTFSQLSSMLGMDEDECYFRFQAAVHYLLENSGSMKMLKRAKEGLEQTSVLTSTAQKTLRFLEQDMTMQETASYRNLKLSTIEDHVVEIASEQSNFPLEQYVTAETQRLILSSSQKLQTKRLKAVKEAVSEEDLDYFSIRLTLAYYGGRYGQTR